MKFKYFLIAFIVIAIIGAAIGLKMYYMPHAHIGKMKTDYKVQASTLIDEFQKEEDAATTKYSEKVLEINGKVSSKKQLPNGTTLLMLEDDMQGISCQMDSSWASANKDLIQALEPGNQVTVKGVCKGYLMEIKVSPAIVVSQK